jgi:shikimate dehydrogenase
MGFESEIKLGVMGHPIGHSLSPTIFEWISNQLKVPLTYSKMSISPRDLGNTVDTLKKDAEWLGWNVTVPHKEAVLSHLDALSPEARGIRAVNVVKRIDGKLHGFNTDVLGIYNTLCEQNFKIQGCTAVIFGAGGASVAAAHVLGANFASKVSVINRTVERAERMVQALRDRFPKTHFAALPMATASWSQPHVDLYIHATPLGMKNFGDSFDLSLKFVESALAFDMIYVPERTPFLDLAADQGLNTVGGLDMLIWQAIAAWEIWIGEIPDQLELKRQLKCHLQSFLNRN